MDELNGYELELERWKELPSRLAACLALAGFSIAVVCGMVAANEPFTIVFRAMLAMIACWFLAWFAGGVIVHAVSRDDSSNVDHEDIGVEDHTPDTATHATDSAAA